MSPNSIYKQLKSQSLSKVDSKANQYRVAVQVGHCSISLGVNEVVDAFITYLRSNAYLVITGCDGSCFNGPQVIITSPNGDTVRIPHVDSGIAIRLSTLLEGNMSPLKFKDDLNGFISKQTRLVLDGCGELDAINLSEYVSNNGYYGLSKAVSMSPEDAIEVVKDSGLRGRGGAYFPTALKWYGARKAAGKQKYIVVNSEEGEPGLFKDRHLMEGVPHKIIEGALIAAYAVGASNIFLYINAEANLSYERMEAAIEEIRSGGLLENGVLGSGWPVNIELRRGAGGYVCGEETTLLNTMEGYRREPRLRPPFPTESGFLDSPTIINNAETLATLPYIFANPISDFKSIGNINHIGTKLISMSGAVTRRGLAEVPFGTTLRYIIESIGGGLPEGRTLQAIAVGGPSSGLLPPALIDTKLVPGTLHEAGIILGAGGVIILDETIPIIDTIRHLAAYNSVESCGKCTPCREGTPKLVEIIDKFMDGKFTQADLKEIYNLAKVIETSSLCGLGQAAGNPIFSMLRFFSNELVVKAE